MVSTIHVHVDPHFSGWLVRLQKYNGSWSNIDADLTDASSNVTFTYSGAYPALMRAYLPAQSMGGDDYEEDFAPVEAGYTFYEDQEVWFTLDPDVIPPPPPPTSMIGGPTAWVWGLIVVGVSIVPVTGDGGLTWVWEVANAADVVPDGGPTGWVWVAV